MEQSVFDILLLLTSSPTKQNNLKISDKCIVTGHAIWIQITFEFFHRKINGKLEIHEEWENKTKHNKNSTRQKEYLDGRVFDNHISTP